MHEAQTSMEQEIAQVEKEKVQVEEEEQAFYDAQEHADGKDSNSD